jgi:predicted RNA-binding protein with RPS1 domain
MRKKEIKEYHARIVAFFLESASVRQTAKQFERQPEYVRQILARNKIDFYQCRSQHLSNSQTSDQELADQSQTESN